ncbi:MAG: hypothetical protein NVS3B26_02060 [Mycobacteriales bacterium]
MADHRQIRDTMPGMSLAIAGALARAGWDPDRIADALSLPPAFAELLCEASLRDGERISGDDARLLAAITRKIEQRNGYEREGSRIQRQTLNRPARRALSRRLLAWNFAVLALAVAANVTTDVPQALRATLLAAALAGLLLTVRQARRDLLVRTAKR